MCTLRQANSVNQYQKLRPCAYMQNCKGLQSLHTAEATFRLCMLTQDKSTKLSYESFIYSGKELELACSKVATKVCGFTFGSISLPLISKRIKEILTQKHLYNAKYLSLFNDKTAFRKFKKRLYFFQISAVYIGVCAYIGSWVKRYTANTLLLTNNR